MPFLESVGRRKTVEEGDMGLWLDLGNLSLNGYERNKLFRHHGMDEDGLPDYREVAYFAEANRGQDGRGAVSTDLDGDGDLDLIVQNLFQRCALLINRGPVGRFLEVKLRGTRSNRDAIGARVEVTVGDRTQFREVVTTEGYLSGRPPTCHFGLGDAPKIDRLTVYWPSGERTLLQDVETNQKLTIVEGTGVVSR